MRYSLLSRFRGTLLGAAIGENYAYKGKKQPQHSSSWGKIAVLGAESLIKQSRLDLEDWYRLKREFLEPEAMNPVSTEAIISTLTVVLFSHEYKAKLRQNLQQVASVFSDDPELQDAVLAVGYAIAQSLREKLNPVTLIPKTLAFLENSQTPLVEQLSAVQILLEQGAGLEMAVTQLCRDAQPNSTPIALAFYCFLSTLEDFRLSIARAARSAYQTEITCGLVGAMSGAYNTTGGIPVGWRLPCKQHWGITSIAQLLQLSDRLFAVWSGVYDPSTDVETQNFASLSSAVAAPRVIQPR
ncbi:ADP-ribosylglycohydrolase family protein [Trichocoleus sp. FACHB-90]|uniref:ADP-ribosylglycohydrolase family protein n=1 Tax=Cyanophyceae TaxID=3028117 RepID=UPI001684587A|nr:ADP-ribosylglycohydrolase family protein [Trichocoleus sp. FACHB-90]MBD1924745.1 ADP-ribosylglycohydrolase family protein [Trichocoleus sp. FACHB-90]